MTFTELEKQAVSKIEKRCDDYDEGFLFSVDNLVDEHTKEDRAKWKGVMGSLEKKIMIFDSGLKGWDKQINWYISQESIDEIKNS